MNNDEKSKLEKLKDIIKEKKKPKDEEIITEKPRDIEQKDVGLKTQINDLNEKMEMLVGKKSTEAKKKGFKYPLGMKRKLKKLSKMGKVQVMLLQNNKNIKPTIGEIKEGMLFIGNKIYDGSTDHIWMWNGKFPTAIVAEWDLKPLTSERLWKKTIEEGSISHPQTIMIRAMALSEVVNAGGPKLGSKTIIMGIIFVVVVGYVLFGNQGG